MLWLNALTQIWAPTCVTRRGPLCDTSNNNNNQASVEESRQAQKTVCAAGRQVRVVC